MVIRRLTLRRFRQFADFVWEPQPGINCLVGPGDSGKTTVLEAIARATSPAPYGPAAEHDYFRRRTDDGFEIELVLGALEDRLKGMYRPPPLWGWVGPGEELRDAPVNAEAVLVVIVRGTPDLELEHRVRSPDGDDLFFSADKRRELGLCRVGDARGSAREFRMARGSLVERTLGRDEVRGAAASAVREASKLLDIPTEVVGRLDELAERLRGDGLVADSVTLELLSPPGQSLLGLLGLALGERGEAIPLSQAGQGTQRLASFLLARALALTPALVVIDELEVGLEPYRRRLLVQRLRKLLEGGGQAFITTHSSTVLSELEVAEVHRLDWRLEAASVPRDEELPDDRGPSGDATLTLAPTPRLTRLSAALARTKDDNAEALLCRLPVVCEGQTEVEVLRVLLDQLAERDGYSLAALGVQLVDGGGQPHVFGVVDAYREAGFRLGLFLDEEASHSGARAERAGHEEVSAATWSDATCTEDALAKGLTLEQLDRLLGVGDAAAERLAEGRRQQLCAKLEHQGELGVVELARVYGEPEVRAAWAAVAHKPGKKQTGWFKPRVNAEALGAWLAEHGPPTNMRHVLDEFWAVLSAAVPVGAPDEPKRSDDEPDA